MILLLTGWAIVSLKFQYEIVHYIDGFLAPVLRQVPVIDLKEGKLSSGNKPKVVVDNPRTGKPIIVIDLKGETALPRRDEDGLFLIGNKEIVQVGGKRKVYNFRGEWQTPFVSERYLDSLDSVKRYGGIAFFCLFFLASALVATIEVFFFGLIGFASSSMLHRPLTFLQSGRIAAIALIPQITLDFIQRLTPLKIPFWLPASILLTIAYLIFGIKAVSPTVNREPLLDGVEISTNDHSKA